MWSYLPEYIFLLAPDLRILWHNHTLTLPEETAYCYEIIHGRQAPPAGCPAVRALEEERPVKAFMRAEGLNKDFYVSVVPVKKEDEVVALWHLAVEIPRDSSLEKDLLYHTYEIIGQLAAGLSHDIKNMLTAALGELQILSLLARDKPQLQRRYQKLTEILNKISFFAQKLCGLGNTRKEKELLNLSQVLKDLLPIIRALCPAHVKLKLEIEPAIGMIQFNRAMVEQIVLNIFLNALQAVQGKGKISIKTRQEEGFVVLTVEDDGVGIQSEVIKKIFDPYFTTKEEGSGLGLSMVKRFVEEAGGKIKVSSQEGVGSRFEVWFPTVK